VGLATPGARVFANPRTTRSLAQTMTDIEAALRAVPLRMCAMCQARGMRCEEPVLDYPAPGQVVACPVLFLDGR